MVVSKHLIGLYLSLHHVKIYRVYILDHALFSRYGFDRLSLGEEINNIQTV